jgi:hypothetical protein
MVKHWNEQREALRKDSSLPHLSDIDMQRIMHQRLIATALPQGVDRIAMQIYHDGAS